MASAHGHDDHGHGAAVDHSHDHGADDYGHGAGRGTDHDPRHQRTQTLMEKMYFPEIIKGLGHTFKKLFAKKFTIDYDGTDRTNPDKFHIPRPGYRGEHYLKKDEDGHVKCVACFMCAAACPSECIHIEGAPTPPDWKNRERYPKRFEIDMLRCIYCGYCEEACPVDAIALSTTYNVVSERREEKIYDRDRLLEDGEKYGLSLSHHHYRPDGVPGALPGPKAPGGH
ncbi:MAG TPA: NADH-quinone oxidoreductase subunit I [Planctomycetota bacterium]|nr:NADH-quinone oxidoreductase subunit I [Planctomycetota bacterium]